MKYALAAIACAYTVTIHVNIAVLKSKPAKSNYSLLITNTCVYPIVMIFNFNDSNVDTLTTLFEFSPRGQYEVFPKIPFCRIIPVKVILENYVVVVVSPSGMSHVRNTDCSLHRL